MDNLLNGKRRFSWDIHWQCNYRCPYCWWQGRWDEIAIHNYYPGREKLTEAWARIYRLYGSAHIDISGGEPFLYPEFMEFINQITDYHSLTINTNLSFEAKELVGKVKSGRKKIKINATFHPLFAGFKPFVEKASFLQDNGFQIGVSYLAWPGQIKDIPAYRKRFANKDFQICLLTFWGDYQGKKYPAAYTEREKEIINPILGERSGENFQVEPLVVQGMLCNAGYLYATIHPDGQVLRCGGGSWEKEDSYLGNLFDKNFRLREAPYPCSSRYCPCNEWAFLLVKNEE
jgi:MoaA/NifB/PqqE/SkfB family radical SAM enzyme